MPLFEYKCPACGLADERLVRAPAPDCVRCSACGAEASRQVPLLAHTVADCGPTSAGGT
jgi:putative FmdB family regulatory protein